MLSNALALSILTVSSFFISSCTFSVTNSTEYKDKVFLVIKNSNQKMFTNDAIDIATKFKLQIVTIDEINSFLELEKIKDILGCDDVLCFSDIIGAFNINYVMLIKNKGKTAVIELYKQYPVPKLITKSFISKESNTDKLLATLEADKTSFDKQNNKFSSIINQITCKTDIYNLLINNFPDFILVEKPNYRSSGGGEFYNGRYRIRFKCIDYKEDFWGHKEYYNCFLQEIKDSQSSSLLSVKMCDLY